MFGPNVVTKEEFLKKKGYSASTYSRRMKLFKDDERYRGGYIAVTTREIYIDLDIYDRFSLDQAARKNHYERIGVN